MNLFDSIKSLFCGKKDDVQSSSSMNHSIQSTDSLINELLKVKEDEEVKRAQQILKEVELKEIALKFKNDVRLKIPCNIVPVKMQYQRGCPESIVASCLPSCDMIILQIYTPMKCSNSLPPDSVTRLFGCVGNDMFQKELHRVYDDEFRSKDNGVIIQLSDVRDWMISSIRFTVSSKLATERLVEDIAKFIILFVESLVKLK